MVVGPNGLARDSGNSCYAGTAAIHGVLGPTVRAETDDSELAAEAGRHRLHPGHGCGP